MGELKRPTVGPKSPQFKRWLVVLDVIPDVGALPDFEQVTVSRRTLNVRAYTSLLEALELLRGASRVLRSLILQATDNQSFRYCFLVVDAGSRTCVTQDLISEWAALESSYESPRANRSALSRDMTRAAQVSKTLTGKGIPVTRLLDGQDPVPLLSSRGLFHSDDVPQNVEPEELSDPFAGAVTPEEFDAAVKRARKAGDTVWLYGLVSLPGLIEASMQRVVRARTQELIQALAGAGNPDDGARSSTVGAVLDKLLAPERRDAAATVYSVVIRNNVKYGDEKTLDLVTRATLEPKVFSQVPRVYRTDR